MKTFPFVCAFLLIGCTGHTYEVEDPTIGEAMWQPRFLQYAAEIAPPGRTGAYMGVAQFPWFLTKVITSMYSGWFLLRYCPADTPVAGLNTETMWLIYGSIAMVSPVLLIVARGWLGKDFKDKA